MSRLLMFLAALSCAVACPAIGERYWIAYEGNDFPESEGWTRNYGAGGADRWIEDGTLVLDGRDDMMIYDSYTMLRAIDPDPGELFIMRVRLKVDELSFGYDDPGFAVASDESWRAGFQLSETRISNLDDPQMSASFEPGLYHSFDLRSYDMRTFELLIDGSAALTGPFTHIISASKVTWGDKVEGAASLSHWDYLEFGVVPEPTSAVALALLTMIVFGRVAHPSRSEGGERDSFGRKTVDSAMCGAGY
jgi:hypothetical protein